MRPKDLGTPAHLISSPRPRPRREKRRRMNKEGSKLLGGIAEDRPVLGELGPTQGDSYGGMLEKQF